MSAHVLAAPELERYLTGVRMEGVLADCAANSKQIGVELVEAP